MPVLLQDLVGLLQGLGANWASVSNTAGATLTGANLMAGFVIRTGPSAAFTDTTDTAANILAALTPEITNTPEYGQTFLLFYANLSAYQATIAAGSNVTLTGTPTVPAGAIRVFIGSVTGPATVTITTMLAWSGATA
jgi:hypothetical protein